MAHDGDDVPVPGLREESLHRLDLGGGHLGVGPPAGGQTLAEELGHLGHRPAPKVVLLVGDEHAVGAGPGDPPQRDERLVRAVPRGSEGQRDLATGLAQPSGCLLYTSRCV